MTDDRYTWMGSEHVAIYDEQEKEMRYVSAEEADRLASQELHERNLG